MRLVKRISEDRNYRTVTVKNFYNKDYTTIIKLKNFILIGIRISFKVEYQLCKFSQLWTLTEKRRIVNIRLLW